MRCIKPVRTAQTAGSLQVPCGRCIACRLNYASMWSQRLMHEKKYFDECCFWTGTYDDEHLPKGGTLVKRDAQLFLKRLRKYYDSRTIRYYLAGEYGEVGHRPHYHAILFGVSKDDKYVVEKAWQNGYSSLSDVTEDRCSYVAKYVVKKLNGPEAVIYEADGLLKEFALMSRGGRGVEGNLGGIGSRFVKEFGDEIYHRGFMYFKGKKVGVPKFYQSKIFTTEVRKLRRKRDVAELQKEFYKKSLDRLHDVGYDSYRDEALRREGTAIVLNARLNMKREVL